MNKYKDAKYILIGEAPGRKGCLQCGVPFCDDLTLCQLIEVPDEKVRKSKEESAQRIFNTFGNDFIAWNAFPYQPCGVNGCNRIPNFREIENNIHFLKEFLEIFYNKSKTILLLGNKAENAFKKLDKQYPFIKLIHPSPSASRFYKEKFWKDYANKQLKK